MHLFITQTQWPVGQGFFHTGAVAPYTRRRAPVVTYAYDCGSSSGKEFVARSIEALSHHPQYLTKERPLDIVFISHLDADHFNGLEDLITSARPRRIVIPQVEAVEKLLLAGTVAREGKFSSAELDAYWEFLEDPRGWIRRLLPKSSIITVLPTGAQRQSDANGNFSPSDQTGESDATEGWLAHFASAGPVANNTDVAWITRRGMSSETFWTWRVYVMSNGKDAIEKFEKNLASTGFPKAKSGPPTATVDTIRKYINDLKAASKGINKNSTSLCLYSGPPSDQECTTEHIETGQSDPISVPTGCGGPGWLGAGDARLQSPDDCKEFLDTFSTLISHVGTFAIPHHGSDGHWNSSLISTFNERNIPVPVAVVGAAKHQGYKHPNYGVLHSLAEHGAVLKIVSAAPSSQWTTHSGVGFEHAYDPFGAARHFHRTRR